MPLEQKNKKLENKDNPFSGLGDQSVSDLFNKNDSEIAEFLKYPVDPSLLFEFSKPEKNKQKNPIVLDIDKIIWGVKQ